MKKPANLRTKDPVTSKRIKSVSEDYETRKKRYDELKELRQQLKEKKAKNLNYLKIIK